MDVALPRLSIITVVYNSVQFIETTILSIVNQTYKNIEYVVIDGGSTDGTYDVVKRYQNRIAYHVSERDKGLYDAMNKGLARATGDYVWFINSGDQIYATDTAEKMFAASAQLADVYYGETLMIAPDGSQIGMRRLQAPPSLTWKSFRDGMLVSHQSVVVRRNLVQPYNLQYRYSADFDWTLYALRNARKVINTQLVLSKFMDGGRTKKTIVPGLRERFRIMSHYYGFLPTLLRHFIIGVRFGWYVLINKRF